MSSKKTAAKMKGAHRVLARLDFEVVPLERGYANRWLRVDVSNNDISIRPVDERMKELWTGGKGFDLWLTFNEVDGTTRWDSPENPICFSPGPLGGTISFPGSGKTLVTAVSPLTGMMMDCNVGGYFGPFLKFAGFDAMMLTGKASEETIVYIDAVGGRITIERAPLESVDSHLLAEELAGMYADDENDLRNIACVSAGRGAEHARMGVLNFSFWDWRRGAARLKQAGRGGIGTVFRDKKLKALVIKNAEATPSWRVEQSEAARAITPAKVPVQTCPQEIGEIAGIIERHGCDPEYVTEMLQDLQKRFRHISKTAIDEINRRTGKPKSHLYHIATFFDAFSLEPKGERVVQVCMGNACHVKGSSNVLDAFERALGIAAGGTTADGRFTLEAVGCLGACSIAPVVRIGETVHGGVKPKDVKKLLADARSAAPDTAEEAPARRLRRRKLSPRGLAMIASARRKKDGAFLKTLAVCTGSGCAASGGFEIRDALAALISAKGLDDRYAVVGTGCHGFCSSGPVVVVQPDGIFYRKVKAADLEAIVDSLSSGAVVERLLYRDPASGAAIAKTDEIPFLAAQTPIALRNKGLIDPEDIDQYIARGGYRGLKKVLGSMDPDDVIDEVIASGIRGRGGGGFPTGLKWRAGALAASSDGGEIYVACNADEGVPGAFAARTILETDPHTVIEGMLIGAFAVGSNEGHVYVRDEYPLAVSRLGRAIAQARAYGLLGEDILGSGMRFDVRVHRGAGAFVCGESSALMASMEGEPGEPRPKYVHGTELGFRGRPTVLNNAETWAAIPEIVSRGAAWFASIGTGDVCGDPWGGSSGTKVFSLAGDVANTGLVEVPLGTTAREIIMKIGGGVPGGRALKAFQTGGPPGGCLPASMIDIGLDFDSLAGAGSMLGSGAIAVMHDRTCMVDVARHSIDYLKGESCGKCTPCREGLHLISAVLGRICAGEGREGDIERLEELCATLEAASLCGLGRTAHHPVTSTLRYFREEYEEHIREKKCRAGICAALVEYRIDPEKCTGCTLCFKNCPVGAITGKAKQAHAIDPDTCIKCGICYQVCTFDAVEVI
ncbi:MAG: NAD(P)H-dependent oxidoreductase subunit E [Candidatus Krumholzibacteria bacterium]|nr:NAD(P)H-dependent oxidoreductase subunit E [Candidatus Krumholzibacteria bacterium]